MAKTARPAKVAKRASIRCAAAQPALALPENLIGFKSTGEYDAIELPDGAWLVWSERIGDHVVVVFRQNCGTARVAVLKPGAPKFERIERVPVLESDDHAAELAREGGAFEDIYTIANRRGIETAKSWVLQLREQSAPAVSDDAEAWLRRQLAMLESNESSDEGRN